MPNFLFIFSFLFYSIHVFLALNSTTVNTIKENISPILFNFPQHTTEEIKIEHIEHIEPIEQFGSVEKSESIEDMDYLIEYDPWLN